MLCNIQEASYLHYKACRVSEKPKKSWRLSCLKRADKPLRPETTNMFGNQ